ncbi:nuclear transport factor 2 family protein [Variovorax sp. J31P207]|uniref:nuclear transport factor 2 family protein n=1 Tax=Variovorax sp. J31P207 TaxID=3053510 RepID=UPI002578C6AC|nr:nuclear transport factor 2 family protein [Variovorax sp. J31P207]MDM0071438.1 nuclear transport factor 2 family protein [Variovorax sp. J31P207]
MDSTARNIVGSLFDLWATAFNDEDPAAVAQLFSADALFQGLGPKVYIGPTEIQGYYERVPKGVRVKVDDRDLHARSVLSKGVAGFVRVLFIEASGGERTVSVSITAQQEGIRWMIKQYHASETR